MGAPWNDWYHCNGNTYGTWLRGDPRGFRERHHRRHVEGDYKNPPAPGTYERVLARSQQLLKRDPVHLDPGQQRAAAEALVTKLVDDGIQVLALTVDDHHFHLLARFPDHKPRHWIGRAKMHAAMLLRDHGLKGGVWARSFRALPVNDRAHQVNVFRYIVGHRQRSAIVWTFRDPRPERR
jgi:hypothetical protein